MKIWIVDDNEADTQLTTHALAEAGLAFEAEAMCTGDEVLARIKSLSEGLAGPPDAVILDLYLMRYSGTELLERISSSSFMATVPVIVLTSSNAPYDRERALKLGARAYLQKSMDLKELMRMGQDLAAVLKQCQYATAKA